jgi:hypothetical protein
MSAQLDFYRARAAEARAGADAATLSNIRDRWLVSEASWMQLADRSSRSEQLRESLIAEKASARVAPPLDKEPGSRELI